MRVEVEEWYLRLRLRTSIHLSTAAPEDSAAIGLGKWAYTYEKSQPLRIVVSGGHVTANGRCGEPGLGSSSYCHEESGGGFIEVWEQYVSVEITGGTVSSPYIGNKGERQRDTTVRIAGGSVNGTVLANANSPNNGVSHVYMVTVPGGWEDGKPVAVTGLGDYGTEDIFASGGKVYLWLPNGQYAFDVNGNTYVANVNGGATTASLSVTVNGESLSKGAGAGWLYAGGVLSLTNAQDYVIAGTNTAGAVRINVTASADVTFGNLHLTSGSSVNMMTFASGATDAKLTLAGVNTVHSQGSASAIYVAGGAKVTVDGTGELVGGKAGSVNCRAFDVRGELVLENGTIRDYLMNVQNDSYYGCGVFLRGGRLTMNGGTISGCQNSWYGGAVTLHSHGGNNAKADLNGGTISGSEVTGSVDGTGLGGGIYNNGTLTITGGAIEDCHATRFGGAIANGSGHYTYIYGGTFKDDNDAPASPFLDSYGSEVTGYLYGGVWVGDEYDPSKDSEVSLRDGAKATVLSPADGDELSVVGKDVDQEGEDIPQLIGGTYTFCPTNAEYVAAYEGNPLVKPGVPVAKVAGTPVTWTLGVVMTYPDYLAGQSYAVTNTFDNWATRYGSRDPDGVYTNAFLLNVATNREAEAVAAFKIESLVVTNDVADITVAKPIDAAMYNGKAWLQCATNDLSEAEWLDIEGGRYTEGGKSFFTLRIDFEHKVTPEAFPTEPEGSRTTRVLVQ